MATATVRSGTELIRQANDRRRGRTEFREVTMVIGAGRLARRLRVMTLRQTDGDIARTLTCLVEPRPLRGINYLTSEHRGRIEPFDIELFLPFARARVRTLEPERAREAVLGSDFTYRDLRTWLYEEGHVYDSLFAEADAAVVRGRCCTTQARLLPYASAPFDVRLEETDHFVSAIDFLGACGDVIVRSYRVPEIALVDGVRVPARMTMEDHVRGHMTSVHLERAWLDRAADPAIFEPARRATAAASLSQL